MRIITRISAALVFAVGVFLIMFTGRFEQHYKELGIPLPGISEDLIDLHRMHADYLLLVLAITWWMKDRYLPGMGYRTALAISGLIAAILLPVMVAVALLMPLLPSGERLYIQVH